MGKEKNNTGRLGKVPFQGVLTWLIALSIIFSAAWFKFTTPISSVIIEIETLPFGKNLLDERDVENQLMDRFKTNFVGWKISEIDAAMIEEEVTRSPFVKESHVYVDAMNKLHIHIVQREPVLRVQDENAISFYIDSEGVRVPLSRHYTARVKVATGHIPRFKGYDLYQADSIYTALFDVSTTIARSAFYEALVEQIYIDDNNDIYLVPKVGSQKIRIGKARDLEEKLDKLRIFMKEGLAYEGWRTCDEIDLRFEHQIVCKKNELQYSHKTQ